MKTGRNEGVGWLGVVVLVAAVGCGGGELRGAEVESAPSGGGRLATVSTDPGVLQVMETVARAQSTGEFGYAATLLDSLESRMPDNAHVQFLRGVQYDATGFTASARAAYLRSRDLDPTFPGAWHNLGSAYARGHSFREALRAYQEAARLESTAGAWHGIGNAYFELGEPDSAEIALRKGLELSATDPGIRLALASILAKGGDAASALEVLRSCAATAFDSECAKEYALLLMKNGELVAALDSLFYVERERPWDKEVYFALSQGYAAIDRQDVAANAAARFEEIDAVDKQIFRLQERIALNPESLRDRFELADRYRSIGRTLDAAKTLSAALVLSPGNLNIRNNIGILLLESDQPQAAAEQFRTILRADSTFAAARSGLAKAETMKAGR